MSNSDHSESVALPLKKRGRLVICGIFWLYMGVGTLVGFRGASNQYVAWVEVVFGASLLWFSMASYIVRVSGTMFSITIFALGLGWWTRYYPLRKVSNLRIYHEPIFGSRRPTLAFQYKGKTKIFRQVKTTNFEHVLDPIYERFPELRPTLVDRSV